MSMKRLQKRWRETEKRDGAFEVKVVGAKTKEQAKVLSKSIVCSNLTKTAIAGHDANWGRILCAMGYSGAQFDPEKVDCFLKVRQESFRSLKTVLR